MKRVRYKGISCDFIENYLDKEDYSIVMIRFPKDIKKAYELGFTCIGYPNEIAKQVTKEEAEILLYKGEIK